MEAGVGDIDTVSLSYFWEQEMKKFTKSQISSYNIEFASEFLFFKMIDPPGWKQRIIQSHGRYGENLSIIIVEDWINLANEMIQKAKNGKGKFSVAGKSEDEIDDMRNDIIGIALEKSSKSLRSF